MTQASSGNAALDAVDVVILGGGLAGLTLALQLKRRIPDLAVLVLERRGQPAPDAIHKIGESSVEIAANYFDTVLGLKDHLRERQLKKFGFRFFFSDGCSEIDKVLELGASSYLATPSYQIDRGIFENFLAAQASQAEVRLITGATVRGFELASGEAQHEVSWEVDGVPATARARWLIDASGRAGLLRRKLGLQQDNGHRVNSVWFRVAARIDVNEWSADPDWLGRCDPPERWLSTNHLMGDGYWVWLIPLASGSHSIGIVADATRHPLERMSSFSRALEWLGRHQPRLAQDLESRRHLLQDFAFLKDLSYGCKRVFSADRWAMTGESGLFLDPFYSPGGDYIAIANTYITELIWLDRTGQPVGPQARAFERSFMTFYDSMLSLYRDQYGIFGDPEVLPVKVVWDYTYYWGVLCQLFFQRRLTDLKMLARLQAELGRCMALNFAMQDFLRDWSGRSRRHNPPVLLDQARLEWFAELNRGLRDELDDTAFEERIRDGAAQLESLAREIVRTAQAEHPGLDAAALLDQLGSDAVSVSTRMLLQPTP
jgi:flavin-dependent dehydrogenase